MSTFLGASLGPKVGLKRKILAVGTVAIVTLLAALLPVAPRRHNQVIAATSSRSLKSSVMPGRNERMAASLGALPLAFEQNLGQTDAAVEYIARGDGYTLFLTDTDAVFSFHSNPSQDKIRRRILHAQPESAAPAKAAAPVRMKIVGGNTDVRIAPVEPLPGKSNYYVGNDSKKWQTGVPQYARVAYKNVYPGIDLAYYGEKRKLEFDFIVAPESNPTAIALDFSGAQRLNTDGSGNLVISSSDGQIVLNKPVAYQQRNGSRETVDARFALRAKNEVTFELGNYDRSRELVIDPTVTFATYLGGTAEDDGYGVAFDIFGSVYVTGQTASTNFPATGGASPNTNQGQFDAFVTKLSADGSTIVYSTYIGGSGEDSGNAIAVDASGDAFVAGGTTSTNFPGVNPFQAAPGGGLDAFVFELNPVGTALTYSTYLGGNGDDVANGIAIDASGNAYVVGSTGSVNFPVMAPIQATLAGASNGFVAKLNTGGSALSYSTFLGGGTGDLATAVAVDSSGNAYVTGATQNAAFPSTPGAFQTQCGTDGTCNGGLDDAFVTVYNAAGSSYIYSTFLGGSSNEEGFGIAVDSAGDAYLAGYTSSSTDFPLHTPLQSTYGGGSQDAFVAKLNSAGSALLYSTYLGGTQSDVATGLAIDGNQNIYITGQTNSTNFPISSSPTQATSGGGFDAFVSEISSAGGLAFSTYLGGSGDENSAALLSPLGAIAVDKAGANFYLAGNTTSTNFPTVAAEQPANAGMTDAFVASFTVPTAPDFKIAATTPAAVSQGTSATSTVTLTAIAGYSSPVNLTCSIAGTGSPLPSCGTFSPASPVTPTSSGAPTTLTITTNGSSGILIRPVKFFYAMWLPIVGLALAGIGFSSAPSNRRKLLGFIMLWTVIFALFLMPACGGGSSGGGGGGGAGGCSGCSPTGTYTVTVTGVGTDAAGVNHATAVNLTIN